MSVNFWWIRHGPTHAKTLIGHTDLPADLSDFAAIERLKNLLPKDAEILSSDLIRAVSTADAIAGKRVRQDHSKALREIDFGEWEGREFADVAKSDPEKSRDFWENPGKAAPPGGESWDVFATRIHAEIERRIVTAAAANIIAVAHFGVILAAIQLAGEFPPNSIFSFKINNLSVTRLSFNRQAQAWTINGINQIP